MGNAGSHAIACGHANRRQDSRGQMQADFGRSRGLPRGGMVPQGPKEAANVDDRGVQRLQVNNSCPVQWGICSELQYCGDNKYVTL